jgi:hypothetical protein
MQEKVSTAKVTAEMTEWFNEKGQLHRLDGPAAEWADGYKCWYQNGFIHRMDGPAEEWSDGSKFWYQNGQRHRLDGPAAEWADGSKSWHIMGKPMPEAKFLAKTKGIKQLD